MDFASDEEHCIDRCDTCGKFDDDLVGCNGCVLAFHLDCCPGLLTSGICPYCKTNPLKGFGIKEQRAAMAVCNELLDRRNAAMAAALGEAASPEQLGGGGKENTNPNVPLEASLSLLAGEKPSVADKPQDGDGAVESACAALINCQAEVTQCKNAQAQWKQSLNKKLKDMSREEENAYYRHVRKILAAKKQVLPAQLDVVELAIDDPTIKRDASDGLTALSELGGVEALAKQGKIPYKAIVEGPQRAYESRDTFNCRESFRQLTNKSSNGQCKHWTKQHVASLVEDCSELLALGLVPQSDKIQNEVTVAFGSLFNIENGIHAARAKATKKEKERYQARKKTAAAQGMTVEEYKKAKRPKTSRATKSNTNEETPPQETWVRGRTYEQVLESATELMNLSIED